MGQVRADRPQYLANLCLVPLLLHRSDGSPEMHEAAQSQVLNYSPASVQSVKV